MNLTELRTLKDGDKVVYTEPKRFTTGKEYEVKITPVGRVVIDDNGTGQFLADKHVDFEIKETK